MSMQSTTEIVCKWRINPVTAHIDVFAKAFENCSMAGFTNCGGCIDGMLVCIEKPTDKKCKQVDVNLGKFYCGRKGK